MHVRINRRPVALLVCAALLAGCGSGAPALPPTPAPDATATAAVAMIETALAATPTAPERAASPAAASTLLPTSPPTRAPATAPAPAAAAPEIDLGVLDAALVGEIRVQGTGAPGGTVILLLDGAIAGRAAVAADGGWEARIAPVEPGVHALAVAAGGAGSPAAPSAPLRLTVLGTPTPTSTPSPPPTNTPRPATPTATRSPTRTRPPTATPTATRASTRATPTPTPKRLATSLAATITADAAHRVTATAQARVIAAAVNATSTAQAHVRATEAARERAVQTSIARALTAQAPTAINTPRPTATPIPPTATPWPTATPVSPTATPWPTPVPPTPTPWPTDTPWPTPTPWPTDTPTPAARCAIPTVRGSVEAQVGARLGCPSGPAQAINITVQNFEGGSLLWLPSPDSILSLRNDGWWGQHANEWRGGEDHFSCDEARAMGRPIMGFGRVWCSDGGVRGALRNPVSDEIWFPDSQIQYFDGGRVLALNGAEAIVLFNDGSLARVW